MSQFLMKPTLHCLDSVKQFAEEFAIGEGDLLFTSRHFYDDFFAASSASAAAACSTLPNFSCSTR